VERVALWDDTCEAVRVGAEADRWLAEALGVSCHLVALPPGGRRFAEGPLGPARAEAAFADGFPYLLAGQGSLDALNERAGEALTMRRFRANLVIAGTAPFAEDTWSEIAVGKVVLRIVKPCERCAVTTNDPDRGVFGKEPLRALATFRRSLTGEVLFAQNAIAVTTGELRVGDPVHVRAAQEPPPLRG
jgi:uncharacterized protein YcbX